MALGSAPAFPPAPHHTFYGVVRDEMGDPRVVTNAEVIFDTLAGTYAFDPADGFRLDLVGVEQGQPLIEFLAIRGRSYVLHGSADLTTWQPMEFRLAEEAPTERLPQSRGASASRPGAGAEALAGR